MAAALGRLPQVAWLPAPREVAAAAKPGISEPAGPEGGGLGAPAPPRRDAGPGLGLSLLRHLQGRREEVARSPPAASTGAGHGTPGCPG